MQLKSNIGQVIGRMKRLQEGIPGAVAEAIDAKFWKGRLEYVALKTLRAQWAMERNVQRRALYERLTPRIIGTLTGETLDLVSRFTLELPEAARVTGLSIQAAVDYKLNQLTPAGRDKKYALHEAEAEEHLELVRQALRDWVTLEKRRDERDEGLSDEQIAERLEEILGISDRTIPRERTPAMEEAAKSLTAAIESWLQGDGDTPAVQRQRSTVSSPTIHPDVVAQWFEAVLLAWRIYLRTHLRDRLSDALGRLHGRLKTELI